MSIGTVEHVFQNDAPSFAALAMNSFLVFAISSAGIGAAGFGAEMIVFATSHKILARPELAASTGLQ